MHAATLIVFRLQGPQDDGDLLADRFDQGEFALQVAIVVGQLLGEEGLVAAGQGRFIFGNHALDAVGEDDLKIGQMADDFQSGPTICRGSAGA